MIGDSIDDAPSLEKANVGIAMRSVGSNIAVDAADIALVDDEIKERPHLMALSKKMMKTINIESYLLYGIKLSGNCPSYFGRTRLGCGMRNLLL